MPWSDFEQQQQFSPMGWLSGAGMPAPAEGQFEDPAVVLARRMRQQSPNVPAPQRGGSGYGAAAAFDAPPQMKQDFGVNDIDRATAQMGTPGQAPGPTWPSDSTTSYGVADMMSRPQPVPMPRPRPPGLGAPPDATGAMASAAPQALAQQPPAPPSLLDRIGNGINNNSELLLSLGAGFAGAPSLGAGMQRAFSNARPLMGRNQTVDALVKRNVPEDLARAMVSSPDIMKQYLPQALGAKQWKLGERSDAFGGKRPFLYDEVSGKTMEFNFGGGAGHGAEGIPTLDNFDPGRVDANLTGWDYAKQYPREVQAAVKAYMAGDVMPTGNQRSNSVTSMAKMVAQKVAGDLGEPHLADDALYPARRKMMVDINASGNSSMGGILANGKSSFAHLADLSDSLVDLGNRNGPNVPGGAHVGTVANWMGNAVLPTPETRAKITAVNNAAGHYGQESTKFYAGSGGGVEERTRALKDVQADTANAAQQAAYLETEKRLMLDRLKEKEDQIRTALGADYLKRNPIITPDFEKKIARIDANVARLKGESSAPAAGAPQHPASPLGVDPKVWGVMTPQERALWQN